MKTHTTAIVTLEIAVTAICASVLYAKVLILAALVESLVRIVGVL